MEGIKYITDEAGHKTALIIDLKNLKEATSTHDFVEELEDTLDVILRENETGEDWNAMKNDLKNLD